MRQKVKHPTLANVVQDYIEKSKENNSVTSKTEQEQNREQDRNVVKSEVTLSRADEDQERWGFLKSSGGSSVSTVLTKANSETLQIVEDRRIRNGEVGKYLYAVIPCGEEKKFGKIGINNEEVYTIPYRDVASVVNDTYDQKYELSADNALRHDGVLRHILASYTVLPAEFGTVFQDSRTLEHMVRKVYSFIKDGLALVEDSVELGVKVMLKKDVTDLDAEQGRTSSTEILRSLKKIAVRSASGDLFSDRLILNESFLVKKKKVDTFSDEVARLESSYPMLKFLYSGPWAPYNFVYLKIGKSGIEFRRSC